MSTMETPPPEMTPPGPPERRCPRCGSTLAPDQEWCLACGAAAGTEVVESTGWRVPIYMGGGLVALAILGVILAIAALSNREETAGAPTPTPSAAVPPGQSPQASPTISPIPPTATPSVTPLPTETATVDPAPTTEPSPEPTETPTEDPPTTEDPSSTYSGWTGADGDYTVIIASKDNLADAEDVAADAEADGHTPGILNSDDFSSLNAGYQVVFVGTYTSKADAEDALPDIKSDFSGAYVRRISNSG